MAAMKNFHVPLSDEVYQELRAQAERTGRPATALARDAIEFWLKHQRRQARATSLAEYVAEHGGGPHDLDPALEGE
jgi:predicted DNA-binding protein